MIHRAPRECDLVVIGGGIVGLAVAREMTHRHPGLEIAVLERAPVIATGQTGHTSGVIHAGIYYSPGSLKARLCVEGARQLYSYCAEHGIDARKEGKLIVAVTEDELDRLEDLDRRGQANEVEGLRRIGAEEIADIEPHARGLAALHSPATGVVDFVAVARAFAAEVEATGKRIVIDCRVRALTPGGEKIAVRHSQGTTVARYAISCAGAGSSRLAVAAGAPEEPRVVPFRGGYLRLKPDRDELVRASIYPVPDPELPFLGAHLTRTFAGDVLLGPSALMVGGYLWPGAWRLAWRERRAALREIGRAGSRHAFVAAARRMVPELRARDFSRGPAGVRAQAMNRDGTLVDDFVVHETDRALHVRNAPSPAATSSLALARLICDRVEIV